MSFELELRRIADALDRIAETVDRVATTLHQPVQLEPGHITLRVDGKTLANEVVRYTLQQATRGPSSLPGGPLEP